MLHDDLERSIEPKIVRAASTSAANPNAIRDIAALLGDELAHVFLFVSPNVDFKSIVAQAHQQINAPNIVACTTAGEISSGYTENQIVAVGLPASHFETGAILVENLSTLKKTELIGDMIRCRNSIGSDSPEFENEFAFLIVDGLSLREDELMSMINTGLGPVPMFGGSAGDGTRFKQTFVSLNGIEYANAAVLTFVKTRCDVQTFSLDHLSPSSEKMVVTKANPQRRIVHEINAEPAAREYARILGKDPDQLSTFTFAANPVVVRAGGRHHVRAIQRVNQNGDLVFFSAIDEGLVLTLADAEDMESHLERELSSLSTKGDLDTLLTCDCILRRLEAAQSQKTHSLSQIMEKHRAIGFNTYGEQFGSMHVNQTMTGVAIYRPKEDAPL
jgi:hypothetical protein